MRDDIKQATERFKKHLESGFYRDRSGKPIVVKECMSEEMTKEQAIEYFRNKTAFVDGKEKQAFEIAILAIAALSAEPCSDAISRQAALNEIEYHTLFWNTDDLRMAADVIRDLPSVHAEPRTGQSKSIPSGLKLKIEHEADYQNERVNADIARGMYLALEIIDKWEADHA